MIDTRALNEHLYEYNVLSNKPKHTPEDSRRMAYLQTAISALKSGASLAEFVEADRRAISDKYGLNIDRAPGAREIEARGWRDFVAGEQLHAINPGMERRDMQEGSPLSRLGTYTGLGYFVPTGFFSQVFSALAAHDALLDDDSVTVIKTTNGRVITVPVTILNRTPVPVVRLNPELPPKLEEVINKALEKDRDLRYQHASEIRTDLKRLHRDTDSGRVLTSGSKAVQELAAEPPSRWALRLRRHRELNESNS